MIPNIVALLGITFPPGKNRNLGMALFGAMAPVGAAGGSLISAVIGTVVRMEMVVRYAVRIIASFPANETVFPLLIISFF